MPSKFCVRCGKEDVKLIDRLCIDCYIKTKKLIVLPKEISGKICKICYAEFLDGKWENIHDNLQDSVKDLILRSMSKKITIDKNVSDYSIDLGDIWKDSNGKEHVKIIAKGKIDNEKFTINENSNLEIEYTICDSCKKKKSRYYEAIIQLRGKNGKFLVEKRHIFESFFSEEEISNLSDVIEGKEGVDYYFIKKSVAKKLASSVVSMTDAEINESFQDESTKKGKRLAKLVISLRI